MGQPVPQQLLDDPPNLTPSTRRGDLPPNTLNGLLNGHQFFRGIWLVLLVVTWLLSFWVDDFKPITHPIVVVGALIFLCGMITSEFRYRKKFVVERTTENELTGMRGWSFAKHRAVDNCNLVDGRYPIGPFAFDFAASALIVLASGGIASPFLPLLLFVGFVGSLAVYDRSLKVLVTSVVCTGGAILGAAMIPWRRIHIFNPPGLEVGNEKSPEFILATAIVLVFLVFSGNVMTKYATDAFKASNSTIRGSTAELDRN